MNQPATLSVVIPAYQSAGTIIEALESVRQQRFAGRIEIIVVDDCSPDHTGEVVEAWYRRESRHMPGSAPSLSPAATMAHAPTLRLVRLEQNGGPAVARNAGIREATAQWVAFLDADDAWLPDKLSWQMRAVAECPDTVMVGGLTQSLHDKGDGGPSLDDDRLPVRDVSLEEFVDVNPVSTSTVLARKSILEQVGGFDERFRGPEDLDLWMRIARVGRIVQIERPLSRYRILPGSLSNEPRTFLPQVLAVYDKAFAKGGALGEHPEWKRRAIGSRYSSACWTELVHGRRLRALRYLAQSVAWWPWRLQGAKRRPLWRCILLVKIILNIR